MKLPIAEAPAKATVQESFFTEVARYPDERRFEANESHFIRRARDPALLKDSSARRSRFKWSRRVFPLIEEISLIPFPYSSWGWI
jgi:hypothetical protein